MKHILATLALILLAATAAADDDVRSKPLTLHAPAPAARALKYALLPELQDTTPGNAVDHYRQAIKNLKQDAPPERDWHPTLDQWMAAPLKDFPREDVAKFLKPCESTFKEVEAGARCEDCDWGLTEKLRQRGFYTPPDVDPVIEIAGLLALRVRWQLAEGRTDQAARTLQTGMAMARHVADEPCFFCAIYGMAMSSAMLDRLEEVIQQPDAPSFYWPLTDLPRPLFDLRKPMQGERLSIYGTFPGAAEMAADLNAKPWTPERVAKIVDLFPYFVSEQNEVLFPYFIDEQNEVLRVRDKALLLARLASRHEAAKKALLDEGRPKELVDAMPHVQVGLRVALLQYDREFDQLLKWQSLPYWEALPAMARESERLKEAPDDPDGSAIPLARLYLRNLPKAFEYAARMDRRVAALRCVEAVRLYAAAHDGKLPSSLEEIKDAPAPTDPVGGTPFRYRRVGDRAFFSYPPFPGQPADNGNARTYELMFQR